MVHPLPPHDLAGRAFSLGDIVAYSSMYAGNPVLLLGEVIEVLDCPPRRALRFHDARPKQVRLRRPETPFFGLSGVGCHGPEEGALPTLTTWLEAPAKAWITDLASTDFWRLFSKAGEDATRNCTALG